MTVLPGDQIVS